MIQSERVLYWKLWLAIALVISGPFASLRDSTLAQIAGDNTLGAENSLVTSTSSGVFQIDGGATRGSNLFHSFSQFSIPKNGVAHFNNASNVQNIISRVTGGSVSNINGLLHTEGTANLFLINPNGIIFGPNSSLKIRGSFLATTASSLNFADGNQFSATAPQTIPLLMVSVPIGLQFGATASSIRNQSQAGPNVASNSINPGHPVGLQVQTDQTLALVGGDITLEGGNLTAAGGRIELGSVRNNTVSLNSTEKGWVLSYEGIQNFHDIQLIPDEFGNRSYVDTSDEAGGAIQVQGKRVMLINGSQILSLTQGDHSGGDLTVTASESVELTGPNNTLITTQTARGTGTGDAGAITISTGKLVLQDGTQILSTTSDRGSAGQLIVNASDSVKVIGNSSVLASATFAAGHAGNLKITTRKLLVQDGAQVTAESSGINSRGRFIPATGGGGYLVVKASDSVELIGTNTTGIPSGLFTSTRGAGDAGELKIATEALIVRNGAAITATSQGKGAAGNLQVSAHSIRMDNQGKITATTTSGDGGNITLQAQDVRLRHRSNISTRAGSRNMPGNGGKIAINTDILVGLENSDITANAFEGKGGTINIKAQGVFGLAKLNLEDLKARLAKIDPDELDPTRLLSSSDITAFSQNPSLQGQVNINRPEFDYSQGLVTLPTQPVDVTGLIAQGCSTGGRKLASQFVVTGRGGLPDNPSQTLSSETVWSDLRSPTRSAAYQPSSESATLPTNSTTNQLVEAQGWITNDKGEVVLTAATPNITPHDSWMTPTGCHAP